MITYDKKQEHLLFGDIPDHKVGVNNKDTDKILPDLY